MNNKNRRREIYESLKRNKVIDVAATARLMGVSCMTIRRDLIDMEDEGLITRSYGKAHLKNDTANEIPFAGRINVNLEYKLSACEEAVSLLGDVSSIYLDGSTTCHVLSTLLPSHRPLTVLTSGLSVANQLRGQSNVRLILPGGFLGGDSNTINTDSANLIPKDVYIEMAFFSCGGFSERGIVDSNLSGAYIRDYIREVSQAIVLVADHTKYRRHGLFSLWRWSDIDHFVTDTKPNDAMIEQMQRHEIRAHWRSGTATQPLQNK